MRKDMVWMLVTLLIVITIIGVGQWHWNKTITETNHQLDRNLEKPGRTVVENAQPRERTLIDMKIDFSILFEEAYLNYETTISQLLVEAEQEYISVLTGEMESYSLIKDYQDAFLEVEQEWSQRFQQEYVALQDEMEAAGYYRDDALEYELEFELRREQTTHAYLQALMMLDFNRPNQVEKTPTI